MIFCDSCPNPDECQKAHFCIAKDFANKALPEMPVEQSIQVDEERIRVLNARMCRHLGVCPACGGLQGLIESVQVKRLRHYGWLTGDTVCDETTIEPVQRRSLLKCLDCGQCFSFSI